MDFRQMRAFLALSFFVLVIILLSGCGHNPPKIVYVTLTKYQEVPMTLTSRSVPAAPLAKAEYLALPLYRRESYLADYTVQTLKAVHSCNAQLESIENLSRTWKESGDARQ